MKTYVIEVTMEELSILHLALIPNTNLTRDIVFEAHRHDEPPLVALGRVADLRRKISKIMNINSQ